jgi:hypothetical protein
MTSETQIEAGAALDRLLAVEAMGWREERGAWLAETPTNHIQVRYLAPPTYSTSYGGMELVLERMRALGWACSMEEVFTGPAMSRDPADMTYWWEAELRSFDEERKAWGEGATLPHAIALAALAAVRA